MHPDNLNFGGGVAQTILSPIVIIAVFVVGYLICFGSSRRAMVGLLTAAIMIPIDQVLVVAGVHFPMLRVLIVFGIVRILKEKARGNNVFSGGFNWLDKCFLALSIISTIDGILLWQNSGAVIFQIGNLYSAIGAFTMLRFFIRDEEDVRLALRTLACICLAVGLLMVSEQLTGKNFYYGFLGGARAGEYGKALEVRDGRLRATGVFAHPILAGTFGDFCIPLFVALWWRGDKSDRKFAIFGILGAIVMPFAANSSTALFGFIAAIIGLSLWPLRQHMRILRWALLGLVVSLHMVMNAPVWQLITRFDIAGNSSSDHRFRLINECIRHFSSWALIGTKDYASWGWSMWDLSDQYVAVADTAGLVPLIAFIGIFVVAYRYIGLARRHYGDVGDKKHELFIWAIGCSVFANTVAFVGIDYFDQTMVAWYSVLAIVCASTLMGRSGQPVLASSSSKVEARILSRSPQFDIRAPIQPYVRSNAVPIPKYNPRNLK